MEDNYLGENFNWSKVIWVGMGIFVLMFIVGTILEIGQSKISNKELIDIIDKSDRIYAGPSVPAHGSVSYTHLTLPTKA